MISMSLSELRKLSEIILLTNTPLSLFEALTRSGPVIRMREEASVNVLQQYFDSITARGRRSQTVLALAYATLVAMSTHPAGGHVPETIERLTWGKAMRDFATNSGISTTRILINPSSRPTIRVESENL